VKKFLLGLILGLLILPLCAFLYLQSGSVQVATAAAPFPFEKKITQIALKARISREAPAQPGAPATPENLIAGAKLYRETCAVCHGLPGTPETPTANGMYPPPPQLLRGKGVTDDPAGETYWKVANGIRLTGMPAYGKSWSEIQMWQVSQMLANAAHLPPEAVTLLTAAAGPRKP
jgi:mono/diheme cytochrome c family protein